MTDRLLSMLFQYLLSNQALELNESFQIYLKVLSIEHSKFKAAQPRKNKAVKKTFKTHVGNSTRHYSYKWAIDVPPIACFASKCLLTCTILALAQNDFFESKENKIFTYLTWIISKVKSKQNYAIKLMEKRLETIFSVTDLKRTGPYELKSTIVLLSKTYKCQFFIFDSLNNSSKIYYMYPKKYDDTLKPIFLYRPRFDSTHVIFIRNLNSYFKSRGAICLVCLRQFKCNRTARSSHLCRERKTCFACRRFFQTKETYLNQKIDQIFCDKFVTDQITFNCPICNCDIYSKKCFRGHKRFCNGAGHFGYKCSACKKFSYCKNNTSQEVRLRHVCNEGRVCRNCYSIKESNHQCPLKIEKTSKDQNRLCFFKIVLDQESNLLAVIFLREETERGHFTKYILAPQLLLSKQKEEEFLVFDYFKCDAKIDINYNFNMTKQKNCNLFQHLNPSDGANEDFGIEILRFILDQNFSCTSYICEDTSSSQLVIFKRH